MGLLRSTANMAVITGMMFVASVTMWLGVPLLWLYIGSLLQSETDSLGLAVIVAMIGVAGSMVLVVRALITLNHAYHTLHERAEGKPPARSPLEPMLVFSVGLAIAVFGFWFVILGGASDVPTAALYNSLS